MFVYVLLFASLVGLDVASKEWVIRHPDIFLVYNLNSPLSLPAFGIGIAALALAWWWGRALTRIGAVALLAGGVGNALYAGKVPDFILVPTWFPFSETSQHLPAPGAAMNLADAFIWLGIVLFAVGLLQGRRRGKGGESGILASDGS